MQGPPGGIVVSNASDINPFELARESVSRSKEAIAAATKDLNDHNRWFKDYLASEKRSRTRHTRWVRRQEPRERLRINRQRMARFGSRAALGLAISVRSFSRSLLKGVTYRLAQLRDLTLIGAAWGASTAYALSSWLFGLLSISFSWISAKGCALALTSLKAASIRLSWIAVEARGLALASLRATSIGSCWIVARARALTNVSFRAASAGFTWTRAKSRDLACASLNAAAIGGSWLAARTSVLAIVSGRATSSGLSWTMAKGHAFALASREVASIGYAWTAARTRTLARASSEASSSSLSWTRAKGHAFALASLDAVSICSAWTAAKTGTLAQASLSAVATGISWMRAKSGDHALKLHHASSIAVPRIQAAAQGGAGRLLAMGAAARATARRQSERASLFAKRLTAQAKGEIDALRRAARVGRLTPAAWRKFASHRVSRKGLFNGFQTEEKPKESKAARKGSEADDAIFRKGEHASSNALICVEPWRCRLPVVQTDRSEQPAPST